MSERFVASVDQGAASSRCIVFDRHVRLWPDSEELAAHWHKAAEWLPAMDPAEREKGYRKWRKAVQRAMDWVDDDD